MPASAGRDPDKRLRRSEHPIKRTRFTVSGEFYPAASAAVKGGLELPAVVLEPVPAEAAAYAGVTGIEEA